MADLYKPDADPPLQSEDSMPEISQLQIENVARENQYSGISSENQVSLADLHQDYINMIAKFLDPKSLLHLQFTCKSLFYKGSAAQRLVTIPLSIVYRNYFNIFGWPERMSFHRDFPNDELQLKATDFRHRTERLQIDDELTPESCDYIDEYLGGRGTIKELVLSRKTAVDATRFNKFLRDFQISEIDARTLPADYFDHPYVRKLEKLHLGRGFPLTVNFITDSPLHSGRLDIQHDLFDFGDDLNRLLKTWASNDKVIKKIELSYDEEFVSVQQEKVLAGWKIVPGGGEISCERPLVIRDAESKLRLVRADESTLYVKFWEGALLFSVRGYPREFNPEDFEHNGPRYVRGDHVVIY